MLALCAAPAPAATSWTSLDTGLGDDVGILARVAVTSQGETVVASSTATGVSLFVRATDGSTSTQAINTGARIVGDLTPDRSGGTYMTWADDNGTEIAYRPAGGVFGAPTLALAGTRYGSSFAVNANGDAVLVGRIPAVLGYGGYTLVLARRTGGVWGAPTPLSPSGMATDDNAGLAVAPSGDALVTWTGTDDQAGLHQYAARVDTSGTATTQTLTNVDVSSNSRPRVAFDSTGRAILVGLRGDARVGYAVAAPGAQFGSLQALRSGDTSDDRFDMAMGPSGRVAIAVDTTVNVSGGRAPGVVQATAGTLSTALPAPVAVSTGAARDAYVAVDDDGRALVAFHDLTGADGANDGALLASVAPDGAPFPVATAVRCPLPWARSSGAAAGAGRFAVLSRPGSEHGQQGAVTLSVGTASGSGAPTCAPLHYGIEGDTLISNNNRTGNYDISSMLIEPGELDGWAPVTWTVDTVPASTPLSTDLYPSAHGLYVIFPHRGRYTVTARVNHNGWWDTRSTNVTVGGLPSVTVGLPPSPVAEAGAPVSVGLNASAASPATLASTALGVEGPTSAYSVSERTPQHMTVTFPNPGVYTITATATDSDGLTSTASTAITIYKPITKTPVKQTPAPPTSCLQVAFPSRAKISLTKRVVSIHALSTVAGCQAQFTLTRPGHKVAGSKAFTFAAPNHDYAVNIKLNTAAIAWLKKARKGTLSAKVTALSQVLTGRIAVRR